MCVRHTQDACVTVVAGSQRCPSGVHDHAGMLMTHESACEACGMAQLAISLLWRVTA